MRDHYRRLGVLMSLALLVGLPAMGYQGAVGQQAVADGVKEGTVGFDLYRGYLIVVRASAGPLRGLSFLLDTGASPTVLNTGVARKLHLEQSPAGMAVVGGKVQAEKAIVPSLVLGPIRRDDLPILVEDLSFLQKAFPVRIDGMIGLDVLGQSAFLIDYGSRKIHFGPSPALSVSIPLQLAEGLATFDVEVDHAPARLLLDTGASSLILFERSLQRPAAELKIGAVQRSTNLGGEFERKQIWLHSLRVGESEFGQEPAFVVSDGVHAGYTFDGLMSPAALGIKKVAIDLARGEVAFSR
jgi:predicted aspartyl protease